MGSSQNVNDTTMRGPTHRAAIKFAKMGKWQFKFLLKTSDYKLDREPDRVFYSDPRFVQHLDEGFRTVSPIFTENTFPLELLSLTLDRLG